MDPGGGAPRITENVSIEYCDCSIRVNQFMCINLFFVCLSLELSVKEEGAFTPKYSILDPPLVFIIKQ